MFARMDRECLYGKDWMREDWWRPALESGLMALENHSWDHNHATLPRTVQREQNKGTFETIDSYADADAEIRAAADWLDVHLAPNRGIEQPSQSRPLLPAWSTGAALIDEGIDHLPA